jgi:protein involved in polysaccharide export with SLBB domain
LDLYDFLTKGSSNNNIALQTGDIVFVPYYEKRVRLRGEVKTPAIFELKANESLKEVFEYAGGFTEIAYQNIKLELKDLRKTRKKYKKEMQ